MAENSGIAWTTHTMNFWVGCQRKSTGCEHCYAEQLVTTRMKLPVWGPPSTTPRKLTSVANRRQPFRWNKRAAARGVRERVFCSSLADVFEDHPMVAPWRAEVFATIDATPALDWLLLTKRPENLLRMLPPDWVARPRPHVWLGTTCENQQYLDERAPLLLQVPAAVRFVSAEPLLGPLVLGPYVTDDPAARSALALPSNARIDWVIVGGESGAGARGFDLDWARSIVAQCRAAGAACFVKQMGECPYESAPSLRGSYKPADLLASMERPKPPQMDGWTRVVTGAVEEYRRYPKLRDKKGGDPSEWEPALRVQEFPAVARD